MAKSSFELVLEAVNDVQEKDGRDIAVNATKLNNVKQLCQAIDEIARLFDGKRFTVDVDKETLYVSIYVECAEVISESEDSPLVKALSLANGASFSSIGSGDLVRLGFDIDSVFDVT